MSWAFRAIAIPGIIVPKSVKTVPKPPVYMHTRGRAKGNVLTKNDFMRARILLQRATVDKYPVPSFNQSQ